METTITSTPLVSVSCTALVICSVVAVALLILSVSKIDTWREHITTRVLRVSIGLMVVTIIFTIVGAFIVDRENTVVVETMESEHGITDLTPVNDNTVTSCSFSSDASVADYTWVTADGERERGIFAKAERQDGSCVYSLTAD